MCRPLRLVLSRALKLAWLARPHALSFPLSLGLRLFVDLLHAPKLGPGFCFIRRRQSAFDHLQAHVLSEQEPPHIDRRHDSLVLVSLVDVGSDVAVEDVVGQPVESFGCEWLCWLSKMGAFGSVNTGDADGNL